MMLGHTPFVACCEERYRLIFVQKIYLFGAEGTSQDRGRPRPASTAASSPAKRAKTSNHDDDAAHDQQSDQGDDEEDEETDHQARRDSEDGEMAEKDSSSTSKHCAAQALQPHLHQAWSKVDVVCTIHLGHAHGDGVSMLESQSAFC